MDKHPELEKPRFKELFGKNGIEWLKEIPLREIYRISIPGIGKFFAVLVLSKIGDKEVHEF